MFADDTKILTKIKDTGDSDLLQQDDLNMLMEWSKQWKWKSFIRYGSNACWIHIITIKYKHRLDNKNIKYSLRYTGINY